MQTLAKTLKLELQHSEELRPQEESLKSINLKHWKLTLLVLGIILMPFTIYVGGSIISLSLTCMAYVKAKNTFTPFNIDVEYKDLIEELEQDWR